MNEFHPSEIISKKKDFHLSADPLKTYYLVRDIKPPNNKFCFSLIFSIDWGKQDWLFGGLMSRTRYYYSMF